MTDSTFMCSFIRYVLSECANHGVAGTLGCFVQLVLFCSFLSKPRAGGS